MLLRPNPTDSDHMWQEHGNFLMSFCCWGNKHVQLQVRGSESSEITHTDAGWQQSNVHF